MSAVDPPESSAAELPADARSLSVGQQRRNLLVFAASTALIYLAAPVLYVGILQAGLCQRLGAGPETANLPEAAYNFFTFMPVVIAFLSPSPNVLRRNLTLSLLAVALCLGIVGELLGLRVSQDVQLGAVILQGAICGMAVPTAFGLLWELVGRGVEERRRGYALSLAYGCGPLLGVVGSWMQSRLLGGNFFFWEFAGTEFPFGYVWLYRAGALAMLTAVALVGLAVVPRADVRRESLWGDLRSTYAQLAGDRVLRTAVIATVLLYAGNLIAANLNLYAPYVLGEAAEQVGGLQNALRFACKFAAGLLLGWVVARTHPKAGMLLTGGLYVLTMCWAIVARGRAFLLAYGLFGAGELVGVYGPNYILSASRPSEMRRNMAFVQMLMAPTAPLGWLFGWIAQTTAPRWGAAGGFQASFAACAAIMLAGMALIAWRLPKRPQHAQAPETSPGYPPARE